MTLHELTFPLVPRRRLVGLPFGAMHSARRGVGSDVAGSRPYRRGDDIDAIDWAASARLSSARGTEEFVVRERFAEEAPRVVLVCDRRPEMALFPAGFPWLRKSDAMETAAQVVADSAAAARGFVGYLEYALGDVPTWRPPQTASTLWELRDRSNTDFSAAEDTLERALDFLTQHRRAVPPGTFVFVFSDFLRPPSTEAWARALEFRWDLVPVVIQDPVWEQSFPQVDSLVLPLADVSGAGSRVRLDRGESERRRVEHETRRERLLTEFVTLGIDPVLVSTADEEEIFRAFLTWADERQFRRGRSW